MNESDVSTKLRLALVSEGAVAWKIADRFHASRPDLLVMYRAECLFLEMKMWPNEPTPLQRDTLNELSSVGIRTYVGKYEPMSKALYIYNWVTKESETFFSFKECAKWLLKQLI